MPESPQFTIPAFSSEAAEAEWLDSNEALIADWFADAAQNGTLKPRIPVDEACTDDASSDDSSVVIRLSRDDLARARRLAEGQGIEYHAWLQLQIHEALERNDSRAA